MTGKRTAYNNLLITSIDYQIEPLNLTWIYCWEQAEKPTEFWSRYTTKLDKMRKLLVTLIVLTFFSCGNNVDYEGRWECIKDSSKYYVFEKVNKGTYIMKWDDRSVTGTVDENGAFNFNGFQFVINKKTNELIPDGSWTFCGNFRKVN